MDTIFGNGSAPLTTGWRPEPDHRGTYGILSTCLITLALCVWTAVHLNIAARDEQPPSWLSRWAVWAKLRNMWPWKSWSWPGQTLRKFGWMMWGIIAPEVVAFTAYRQYMDAASLKTDFQKRFPVDPEYGTGRRNEWTLTHSFFAAMGGFEIVVKDKTKDFLPPRKSGQSRTGLTLTTEGLRWLAEKHPHLIEDIPVQQIQDKSKGSAFAKTLVCLQAIWFCVQCITRLRLRLGISLLELNTFGHALCTLAIYMVWWRKPLDIEEPLQIQIPPGPESEAVAFMCMAGKLDLDMPELIDVDPRLDQDGEILTFRSELVRVDDELWRLSTTPASLFPSSSNPPDNLEPTRQTVEVETALPLDDVAGAGAGKHSRCITFQFRESVFAEKTQEKQLKKNPSKLAAYWSKLSHRFRTKRYRRTDRDAIGHFDIPYRDLRRYLLVAGNGDIDGWFDRDDERYKLESLLTDRVRNSPKLESIRTDWMLYLGFGFVGLIYGGLHCFAWYAPFQTEAERFLWRASSVIISANGLILVLLYTWELSPPLISLTDGLENLEHFMRLFFGPLATQILDDPGAKPKRWPRTGVQRNWPRTIRAVALTVLGVPLIIFAGAIRLVYDVAICAMVVAYVAARVFLLVECFVSFARLPESAYLTPQWSRYVPHIV